MHAIGRFITGGVLMALVVHFRALTTSVRFTAGSHFVVLVATDASHVPLRPLLIDSVYFFVR